MNRADLVLGTLLVLGGGCGGSSSECSGFLSGGEGQVLYKEPVGGHPKMLHQDASYFEHKYEGPCALLYAPSQVTGAEDEAPKAPATPDADASN